MNLGRTGMKVTGKKEERSLFYRREILTGARLGHRENVRTASFHRRRDCEFLDMKELRRKFSTCLWRAGWRVRLFKPNITKETRVQWRTISPPPRNLGYGKAMFGTSVLRIASTLPLAVEWPPRAGTVPCPRNGQAAGAVQRQT